MKRITFALGVMASTLLLTYGMALAQQVQHHGEEAEELIVKIIRDVEMCKPMMHDPVCKELHQYGCPGFYEKYAEELGLSDKQVNNLKAIWSKYKKGVIRKKADIKIAEIELSEILGQDTIDFGKAKAKITKIGSMKQDIRLDHLNTIEKGQKVLTAEQLTKFRTLKKKCCQGMMEPGMGKFLMKKCK